MIWTWSGLFIVHIIRFRKVDKGLRSTCMSTRCRTWLFGWVNRKEIRIWIMSSEGALTMFCHLTGSLVIFWPITQTTFIDKSRCCFWVLNIDGCIGSWSWDYLSHTKCLDNLALWREFRLRNVVDIRQLCSQDSMACWPIFRFTTNVLAGSAVWGIEKKKAYRMIFSSERSRWSLISTISNRKSSTTQSIWDRYKQISPKPCFPLWICNRWPLESWQSSPKMASKRLLNISWAVSPPLAFITLQILSSFVPVCMDEGKPLESVVISLTSALISVTVIVGIFCEVSRCGGERGRREQVGWHFAWGIVFYLPSCHTRWTTC